MDAINTSSGQDVMCVCEFPRFLELPKYLHKKLITEYFDCISALRCLQVCKYIKNAVSDRDVEILRFRVIKYVAYENQVLSGVTNLPWQCQLCGTELSGKNASKHAAKHEKRLKQGKPIPRVKDIYIIPEPCSICEAPFPQRGPHVMKGCPLEIIACENYTHTASNPWAESLCSRRWKGFRKAMQYHDCSFRCKSCKLLFKSDESIDGLRRHLRICEFKMEIITLWGITLKDE